MLATRGARRRIARGGARRRLLFDTTNSSRDKRRSLCGFVILRKNIQLLCDKGGEQTLREPVLIFVVSRIHFCCCMCFTYYQISEYARAGAFRSGVSVVGWPKFAMMEHPDDLGYFILV